VSQAFGSFPKRTFTQLADIPGGLRCTDRPVSWIKHPERGDQLTHCAAAREDIRLAICWGASDVHLFICIYSFVRNGAISLFYPARVRAAYSGAALHHPSHISSSARAREREATEDSLKEAARKRGFLVSFGRHFRCHECGPGVLHVCVCFGLSPTFDVLLITT